MASSSSESENNIESDNETGNGDENKGDTFNPLIFFKGDMKELCLYKRVNKFYKSDCKKENIIKMIDIVNGKSKISLRILDWFVTKYSKKRTNDIVVNNGIDDYDVRIDYKSVLKSYKKKNFDPFRRREDKKFEYYFDKDTFLKTTLGQLNFFRWAISFKIVQCVEDNIDKVIKEMNSSNKEEKVKKSMKKQEETKNVTEQPKSKKINDDDFVISFK